MIVQSAPEGQEDGPRFVLTLQEHLELVGQLAETFGNDEFDRAEEPREEFYFMARNHDKGWQETDETPPLDPKTGLPYNLAETPIPMMVQIGPRSIEFNEKHHPYCGLVDSMHMWGLYNGRYGFSDKVLINMIPEEHRPALQDMLDNEEARQTRIKAKLAADPETAAWVEEKHLFRNYKLLQLFDTLALYFNCTHESGRAETTFTHVPKNLDEDVDVSIWPMGEGRYGLAPYPFREDGFEISFSGRYMSPFGPDDRPDMVEVMRSTPTERQTARLVAG